MGWPTWRHEYYLGSNGEIYKHLVSRPSGYGIWKPLRDPPNLVAIVTRRRDRGLQIEAGPQLTPSRECEIVRLENGNPARSSRNDLGKTVPAEVQDLVAENIRMAAERVTQRLDRYQSESGMLDALLDRLDESFQIGDWSVRLHGQSFSPITKEPNVGADGAWIVEIRNGEESTTKALWVQAKQAVKLPRDLYSLKDLREQLSKMRNVTRQAYALVFTRDGVYLANEHERLKLDKALVRAIQCDLGDQNPEVIATSFDLRRVGYIEIDGG